ncbi:MAG: hypothetical protein HZC43_07375 [Nitrosomonadales bacterium]|nr:hypothetical protein [Nitrosomonadales bacterium]
MGIAMDIDSYGISCDSLEDVYSEEVMYSGWNPAITLLCQQQLLMPTNRLAVAPEEEFAGEDDEILAQSDCWNETGFAH